MNTQSFPYQKGVRAMGTTLATISVLGLLSWLMLGLVNLFFPPAIGILDKEGLTYFDGLAEGAPDASVTTDEDLKNHFRSQFSDVRSDLPDGVTEEVYTNTMVYFTKVRGGEVIGGYMLSDGDEILDEDFNLLSGGMTEETTLRELMFKDRAFFEAHLGTYRLFVMATTVYFSMLSLAILRMAWSWRQGAPFGPGTVQGLRWLGILFLAQFLGSWVVGFLVPDSGLILDFVFFSSLFDELISYFGMGASLSCGIVFLTLSWVLDYGRKMQEEQALTV